MKQFYSILIIILLASFNLIAQTELPFNLNGAFIPDSKGFNIIKSKMTYDSGDYLAETYNYFDSNGLNYKTVDFYKGEKQGFVNLTYDKNDRLTGFKDYSQWINSYDSNDSSYWDSTLVSWENQYRYDSLGRLIFCSNLWYHINQKPNYRQELKIEYNDKGQILKKTEYYFDLSDSQYRIYFEPNSTKIALNQNYPANSVDLNIYKYFGDTIKIENYRQNNLKTIQKIVRKDEIEKEFLVDSTGKLLRTKTRTFDKSNNLIEEKCVGDCDISIFGGYSDGITYDWIIYKYSSTGLLLKKTFIDSKYNSKMYIDYEYIK